MIFQCVLVKAQCQGAHDALEKNHLSPVGHVPVVSRMIAQLCMP
jgi:hypothetical protein